ncbi:MAG: ATP-binding protein [Parachlamydiales bacterium]
MFSFRQKLIIGYLLVFLLFLALLFPFAKGAVEAVVRSTLADRTSQVIARIEGTEDEDRMIQRLEQEGPYFFFRISLIEPDGQILFDSHTEKPVQPFDPAEYLAHHPEIREALEKGQGYHESYSASLGQELVYTAKRFTFQGKTYVLRTAFPVKQVHELTYRFEFGFFTLGVVVLLLFGFLIIAVAQHISRPIDKIIRAIKPYQEGKESHLPEIYLGPPKKRMDDFDRLAGTLNSLNQRIEKHIGTLEEERNEKEAILEALIEGVIAVDHQLIITYANSAALQMLGKGPEGILEHPFSVTEQPEFEDLLRACQAQQQSLTATYQLGDRQRLYLDVIAAPKKGEAGSVLVLQDKTAHYRALEMRKDFVANASHELKTPITIIRGFAEALHDNPGVSREVELEVTSKIINSCGRMEALIKNLLRLADVENLPRGQLQECKLDDLLERCRQMTLSVYTTADITLVNRESGPVTVLADAGLLEHAFTNLLDNAAKYSKGPAKVRVEFWREEPFAKIAVADQGIGIPAEDLPHIFDRFYTVDKAHSRRMGGSGLGLSLVQTIIEKHQGRVTVESTLGQGTTFTVLLPLNPD